MTEIDCAICYDTVLDDDKVHYNDSPNAPFKESPVCISCVKNLINEQWDQYYKMVTTDTCKKTVRSLIIKGPPQNVSDTNLFDCDNPRKEVHEFKYQNETFPANLHNAFTGEEREKWIKHLDTILQTLDLEDNTSKMTITPSESVSI